MPISSRSSRAHRCQCECAVPFGASRPEGVLTPLHVRLNNFGGPIERSSCPRTGRNSISNCRSVMSWARYQTTAPDLLPYAAGRGTPRPRSARLVAKRQHFAYPSFSPRAEVGEWIHVS